MRSSQQPLQFPSKISSYEMLCICHAIWRHKVTYYKQNIYIKIFIFIIFDTRFDGLPCVLGLIIAF